MSIEHNSTNVNGEDYTLGERILEKVFLPLFFSWFGKQDKFEEKRPPTPSSGAEMRIPGVKTGGEDYRYYQDLCNLANKLQQEGLSERLAFEKAAEKLGLNQ